ncbi:hypothetical protein L208DRAFT_1386010 [Tricholoma matsutake]|nr:hypothetical protein L208DRAFT_1419213 [Tricholoma matsutake 945]KAF8239540.1 hypothetical protein L208DRAFT_1386010 [Tricholoma matsutake 945]
MTTGQGWRGRRGPDDGEEDNNGNSEDNENNPNVNDGRPSTHPYRCEQLLAGWTAGATDDDNTGIGVGNVAGEWGTTEVATVMWQA